MIMIWKITIISKKSHLRNKGMRQFLTVCFYLMILHVYVMFVTLIDVDILCVW